MDDALVANVERIYANPNALLTRFGSKAHADLVVLELAILEELRRIRAILEARDRESRR